MFLIMIASSVGTLIMLPAIISAIPRLMFDEVSRPSCKCAYCMLTALITAGAVAYVLSGYTTAAWTLTTFITIGVLVIMAGACNIASRRKICIAGGDPVLKEEK